MKLLLGCSALIVCVALSGCTMPASAADPVRHARFVADETKHWQIQLNGAFDPTVIADVYDLDPYTTEKDTVRTIVDDGHQAICHLDVGAADLSLPDAATLPDAVLGAPDGVGRRWLDIRQWDSIRPVLTARMKLCRAKGFQAVDADETFGYAHRTGFDLTSADQIAYDRRVADLAHSLGLAAGVRTPPATAATVVPFTDFAVVAGCFTSPACADYFPYVLAGKAVYDVETNVDPSRFCMAARAYGFLAIRKPDPILDAPVTYC